ncbi:MAG: hypothetical protein LBP67_04950 [Bacteroidales bacterium]|jgi:hypothetical protein|nr:hypothetical protein [Bacteroidales bacterium]
MKKLLYILIALLFFSCNTQKKLTTNIEVQNDIKEVSKEINITVVDTTRTDKTTITTTKINIKPKEENNSANEVKPKEPIIITPKGNIIIPPDVDVTSIEQTTKTDETEQKGLTENINEKEDEKNDNSNAKIQQDEETKSKPSFGANLLSVLPLLIFFILIFLMKYLVERHYKKNK